MAKTSFLVPADWTGRLFIVTRPRGKDWLPADVAAWRAMGIDVVISALRPPEAVELGLVEEGSVLSADGIQFTSCAIQDRGTPASFDQFDDMLSTGFRSLKSGKTVAVHCRQSIGRASIIAAGFLVKQGYTPNEALDLIRSSRGCPVPDTPEQELWVSKYASWVAGQVK